MKKFKKFYVLFVLLLLTVSSKTFAAEDAYNKMAKEFSESAALLSQPKIAIMPFIYLDKRISDGGPIVSERLTTRIVKLKKFKVIERQLLEKVLNEQNLGTTGIIDVESTKKLGKILGVGAIITGTLLDVENQMVEINARLINTETAEVIATSSVEIKKIWSDVPTSQPQQPTTTQPAQQPSAGQPSYYQPAPSKGDSFFDIFMGGGSGTMNVGFKNDSIPIYEYELSLDMNGDGDVYNDPTYYEVSFEDLKTAHTGLLWGFRFGGFGAGKLLGGDFEISHYAQQIAAQKTIVTLNNSSNNSSTKSFSFYVDDYLKVNTYLMAGDLLLRLSSKTLQPYIGIGIGMTMNNTTSPYIYQFYGTTWKKPLDQLSVGFLFRIPIGLRIKIGESTSAFLEYRSTGNTFTFTRDIESETDTMILSTGQTIFGMGFGF
ncbi:MAG: FlgO family outer membrane protein [Elusimicrobiota bacterium]|nr:FlgO family outer membrane protein [Elusimicrobiota bacterium]